MALFSDRQQVGAQLGEVVHNKLTSLGITKTDSLLVLGLARGGLPVAREVAAALKCDFDAVIVRKLGFPFHQELAFGAISEQSAVWLNQPLIDRSGISQNEIATVLAEEQAELKRRVALYRGPRKLELKDRKVVLVDDGIATGATMRAAIEFVKSQKPWGVYVAVPVATKHSKIELSEVVDDFICPELPEDFSSVGEFFEDFSQVSDEEVIRLLATRSANR